ncbi:MAG TPA: septum formation initiator family protein [bacterium]|nr:septum formation initiator family protein [bacterium]HOM27000.1 septum formation initiator family protein [bacterium]
MRKIRKNWFLIFTVFFTICCGIRLKTLISSYQTYRFYKNEIANLERENKNLQEKIEKIKNDPFYIEKILREEYGMIKEGELIIKTGE